MRAIYNQDNKNISVSLIVNGITDTVELTLPFWVSYVAVDSDGTMVAYGNKPFIMHGNWNNQQKCDYEPIIELGYTFDNAVNLIWEVEDGTDIVIYKNVKTEELTQKVKLQFSDLDFYIPDWDIVHIAVDLDGKIHAFSTHEPKLWHSKWINNDWQPYKLIGVMDKKFNDWDKTITTIIEIPD